MYEIKSFENVKGIFSDVLLETHLKLYKGYVTNTNKIIEMLKTVKLGTIEFAEVKRRFGWEFNGMRLHELYFRNLINGGKKIDEDSSLFKTLVKQFGFYESFVENFKTVASLRGIGWVVLYADNQNLFISWVNEHDVGHFSGCNPLLVIDVFEHAFLIDFGLDKKKYIDVFFENIDWGVVEKRFSKG